MSGSRHERVTVMGGYQTQAPNALGPNETYADVKKSHGSWLESSWKDSMPDGSRGLDYYFNSYSHLGIHEEMLKDRVRTNAYYRAITDNACAFEGKVVLDIGAGTGVLSMFAAKAGARHVYGIEYSDVANLARELVAHNGLSEKVTIIQAKAEEAELPVPPNSVDIIISEWMGYFLLYESMLDCVLVCRDKWLKPDGMILPDKCAMYVAALEDGEYRQEKMEFWDNVYGLDYSIVKRNVIAEPLIDTVEADKLVTDACCIYEIDLRTVKVEDLDFVAKFTLTAHVKDFAHALVSWFDCTFQYGLHKPLVFSTAPHAQYTHWKQTVFYLPHTIPLNQGDQMQGLIAVKKAPANPRTIDVNIKYLLPHNKQATQLYHIR